MAVFPDRASSALKDCCIPGTKWRISDRSGDLSCLFWQAFLVIIDVTSFFSNAWDEKGGGVG
jgi:NaMN:DMB phosphoribosyltransferase